MPTGDGSTPSSAVAASGAAASDHRATARAVARDAGAASGAFPA